MAFSRPTLDVLKARIRADINARVPGADTRMPFSVLGVLADVIAGAVHLLYGFLDWISRQIHPDTADDEWLLRHGDVRDIQRIAATKAQGDVVFSGTNGVDIPPATTMQRADGVMFVTDALVTVAVGSATVSATAVDAGVGGVTLPGVPLTLVSPIAGIDSIGVVDVAGLTGGADEESVDAYRVRVLARWRQPTQGGNTNDYITWANEVAGITRAWVYPLENGDGTLVVRFMMDDTYGDGIPLAGDVVTLQAHLDIKRPVIAIVTAAAPTAKPIDMAISITPDTAQIRADAEAEINDLFRRRAMPGGSIYLSQINEAVSISEGEEDHTITGLVADVTSLPSEIPVVGVITWL